MVEGARNEFWHEESCKIIGIRVKDERIGESWLYFLCCLLSPCNWSDYFLLYGCWNLGKTKAGQDRLIFLD
jgi:hypothetical protein